MSSRWLLLFTTLSTVMAQEKESVFDKAARAREAARQRAFDRGQRTALPAAEERESIGRMQEPEANAVRSEDGKVISQGPPSAAVYNRVMETARFFKHYGDPYLRNANDTFTDSPAIAKKALEESQRIYPDLLKPQSAFALRYAAINHWVDRHQPPLVKDARRPLLVSHMVSLEQAGQARQDRFGLSQFPMMHSLGERPPTFIKRNSFEIEVQGEIALLPDGLRGTVKRGQNGSDDIIQWLDAEGNHTLRIPNSQKSRVEIFRAYDCDCRRTETLNGNYRLRFTP